MKRKIFMIVFLFFAVRPVALFSSEGVPLDSSSGEEKMDTRKNKNPLDDLDSLRNPFTPQLPLPLAEKIQKPAEDQSLSKQNRPSPDKTSQPAAQEPLKPPVVKISGLIWNSANPQAIINDRIVRVGDQIEVWTIEKINKDSIEISAQGKKVLIPAGFGVQGGSVKEPVNPKK